MSTYLQENKIKGGLNMEESADGNLISTARKNYYKTYRSKNKERIKQHTLNFWKRKAEQLVQKETKSIGAEDKQ